MDRHTTGKLMSGLLALGQLAAGVYLVAHGGSAETYALGAVLLAGVGGTALLPRLREPRPTERRQVAERKRPPGVPPVGYEPNTLIHPASPPPEPPPDPPIGRSLGVPPVIARAQASVRAARARADEEGES